MLSMLKQQLMLKPENKKSVAGATQKRGQSSPEIGQEPPRKRAGAAQKSVRSRPERNPEPPRKRAEAARNRAEAAQK